jgi:opacity protein-like surface antigen
LVVTGPLASQERSLADAVEQSSTGIGAHLSMFFNQGSTFRSGLEIGYSKLGRTEFESLLDDSESGRGFQSITSSTKLWHAGLITRRQWPAFNDRARLYAVGGTGLYMGRTSTEQVRFEARSPNTFNALTTGRSSWDFGVSLGAGIELHQAGLPGGLGFDARVHLLPFSGTSGQRALFTFSAGMSFF